MWETMKGKNPRTFLDGGGKSRYLFKACIKGRVKLEWMEKKKLTKEYPPTARDHVTTKTNTSNDFHETLISKWEY